MKLPTIIKTISLIGGLLYTQACNEQTEQIAKALGGNKVPFNSTNGRNDSTYTKNPNIISIRDIDLDIFNTSRENTYQDGHKDTISSPKHQDFNLL